LAGGGKLTELIIPTKKKRFWEAGAELALSTLSTDVHLPAPILAVRAADSIVFDDQMDFAVSAELYCHCTRAVLEKRIYVKNFVTSSLVMIPIGTALCD
jgi:hypothetical protein